MKINTVINCIFVSATIKIDNNYIQSEEEKISLGLGINSTCPLEKHINDILKIKIQK